MKSKIFLSLLLAGIALGGLQAADSGVNAPPTLAGPLQWMASDALVKPASDGRGIVSVKDPSIVRYNDRWHIYVCCNTVASASGRWPTAR